MSKPHNDENPHLAPETRKLEYLHPSALAREREKILFPLDSLDGKLS